MFEGAKAQIGVLVDNALDGLEKRAAYSLEFATVDREAGSGAGEDLSVVQVPQCVPELTHRVLHIRRNDAGEDDSDLRGESGSQEVEDRGPEGDVPRDEENDVASGALDRPVIGPPLTGPRGFALETEARVPQRLEVTLRAIISAVHDEDFVDRTLEEGGEAPPERSFLFIRKHHRARSNARVDWAGLTGNLRRGRSRS